MRITEQSIIPMTDTVNQFIDTQMVAMQRLYAEGQIAALRGTTEDLSGDPTLQAIQNVNVGNCSGTPTA